MKKDNKLSEDNKLMGKFGGKWIKLDPGTTYEFDDGNGRKQEINMPISQYLAILMVMYKAEGKPKPTIKIDMPAVKRKVMASQSL